jgi:RNA recognition motif-containing protein
LNFFKKEKFFSRRLWCNFSSFCISLWSQQIRETPHKCNHKFIEYYDIRAAEAALRALNRSDISGKVIKLEPSRPGGTRRYLSFFFPPSLLSFTSSSV